MTSDPLAAPEPGRTVAVLGTGIMGSAMARNLTAAGLFADDRPAFAPGAAWAQMGTIGVTATTTLAGRLSRSPVKISRRSSRCHGR